MIRRDLATSIAAATLLLLFSVAAFAPFLANERPLFETRDGGVSWPAFAALGRADVCWIAAACAALIVAVARGRARIALLIVILVLSAFAIVARTPRLTPPTPGASTLMAPVPHGQSGIDLDHLLLGVGAAGHPLGTDALGRDVFARVIHGLRVSLLVGFGATAISCLIGLVFGLCAGFGGRFSDGLSSWVIQTSFCLPAVFVVGAVQSAGRVGLVGLILLIGILRFGLVARLVRQECARLRPSGFLLSARGLGLHPLVIAFRHVLPHAALPVTVAAAFGVGAAIGAEAALSFLGIGLAEPIASLGRMMNDGRRAGFEAPHLIVIPGVLIAAVIMCCQRIGGVLRDRLDPRGAEVVE